MDLGGVKKGLIILLTLEGEFELMRPVTRENFGQIGAGEASLFFDCPLDFGLDTVQSEPDIPRKPQMY
jgi:hypothetical protein